MNPKFFKFILAALCGVWAGVTGHAQVSQTIGAIPAGDSIIIYSDVTINNPPPPGLTQISSQGTVQGTNFSNVSTDDPDTGPQGDATITTVALNTPPAFAAASPQSLRVCRDATATSINSLLTATDGDAGQMLTWTVSSPPANGSLGGFPTTASTSGSSVTPTGLTYTPTAGHSGTDAFTIQVSDGSDITTMTINVNVVGVNAAITSTTDVACHSASTGSATVSVTGGDPAYLYSWSPSGGTSATASMLLAGVYTVSVTEDGGCTGTATANITEPPAIMLTSSLTSESCPGSANGAISVTASGGTPGYTYDWSPGTPAGDGTSEITGLSAGSYNILVTDGNGCTVPQSYTLTTAGVAPFVSVTVAPSNAVYTGGNPNNIYLGYGPQSATFHVSATGGSGFFYAWTPADNLNDPASSSPLFTPATNTSGTYSRTVSVTNSDGCSSTRTVVMCVKDIRVPASPGSRGQRFYTCGSNGTQMLYAAQLPQFISAANPGNSLGQCGQSCGGAMRLAGGEGEDGDSLAEMVAGEALAMVVYPNPSAAAFTLRVESTAGEEAELRIVDLAGRTVERMGKVPANVELSLGAELSPGIYFIEARSGGEVKMMKVVKL